MKTKELGAFHAEKNRLAYVPAVPRPFSANTATHQAVACEEIFVPFIAFVSMYPDADSSSLRESEVADYTSMLGPVKSIFPCIVPPPSRIHMAG
jgi:hypothetical protein